MNMLSVATVTADRVHGHAGQVPGVSLVVVGPEGVRASGSSGWADLAKRVPMMTDVAMPWFSMTKIATATLAVALADQGLVDLDEPVIRTVEEVGLLQPSGWAERINARHLIQHTAGLPNPIPVRWIHPREVPGPDQDAMLTSLLTKHRRLRGHPGARASYSNLGALIAAAWITRTVGTSFDTLMREHVLHPLGMSTTDFGAVKSPSAAATGYHPRGNPMRFLLPRWVSGRTDGRWLALQPFALDGLAYGGLVGTPAEAARFVQMHLADGTVNGKRIISEESARAMRSIDAHGKRIAFGMGWFRPSGQPASPAFVQHIGGGAGFHSVMRIYPQSGVGAVVMGNATAFDADAVAKMALDFQ